MTQKAQPIKFQLIGINTEEFAKFDDNLQDLKNVDHKLIFGFNIDKKQNAVLAHYEVQAFSDKEIILKGTFNFAFKIQDQSWNLFKKDKKIILPKDFLTHLSVISLGVIRGVFYEKLHKLPSVLSKYIFPLTNISQIVNEDIEFKLENK